MVTPVTQKPNSRCGAPALCRTPTLRSALLFFGFVLGFLALVLGFSARAQAAPASPTAVTAATDQSRLFTLPTPPADPADPMPPTDKVTIADNAALALGSAFTLQAWVRPATDSGEQTILE